MADEFRTRTLPGFEFDELLASARFEELGNGRRGAVLVKLDGGAVPIVRTTTPYREPAEPFRAIHDRLAAQIGHPFNNALIEHYTNAYSTMKRHSDQALDLAVGSSIAVYSCYREPTKPSRRLLVAPKESGTAFELPLAHGSVVEFSLESNRRFTHTIALVANAANNDWLGVTFRTSMTFVRFVEGQPQLANGPLRLATEAQRREFFAMRRRENDETDFTYPSLDYTISASDLLPPSSAPGSH